MIDNCQDTIFGGFAPQSQTAETLSKALGSRTVLSGSVSKGKNDTNRSLQMMERPLMTPDELKSIPKGEFVVMKTGTHPMRTRLRFFLDWGITFGEAYQTPEYGQRKVYCADRMELEKAILAKFPPPKPLEKVISTASTVDRPHSGLSYRKQLPPESTDKSDFRP